MQNDHSTDEETPSRGTELAPWVPDPRMRRHFMDMVGVRLPQQLVPDGQPHPFNSGADWLVYRAGVTGDQTPTVSIEVMPLRSRYEADRGEYVLRRIVKPRLIFSRE